MPATVQMSASHVNSLPISVLDTVLFFSLQKNLSYSCIFIHSVDNVFHQLHEA